MTLKFFATEPANLCTLTTYDALGRRSSSEDPLGNVTEFAYDGLGRVVTTTQYLDSSPLTMVTTYDALGNRLGQTDANNHTTAFSYDSLNRLETTISPEGVVITQTYNAAGWVITTTDGLNHETVMAYDQLGRRMSVTDAESNTTQYTYDALGNQVAITDAASIQTSYLYDDLNRLVGVVENDVAGNNPTEDTDVLTEYVYDAIGNRVVITNARGYTSTTTTYDVLNRPVTVEDALGNQTQTAYNALGYRTVMTDGNGEVTVYSYDDLNRLESVDYEDDEETVSYEYDALGNRLTMTDSLGVTSYVYDDLYRLTNVTDPFTGTVGYGYDDVGNRIQLTYPDSKVVTYTHDADNRLTQVEDWDSSFTNYEYDGIGRLITTTLPNNVATVNEYDAANRLISLRHTDTISDVLLAEYMYELDGVGNRITATETIRPLGTLPLTGILTSSGVTGTLQQEPEVAYNSVADEYLVVWQDDRASSWDIYGQRVDGDGSLLGSNFLVGDVGTNPTVAYSPDDNTYLVVIEYDADIWAQAVDADGTVTESSFRVFDTATANPASEPDVVYNASSDRFLVVWRRVVGSAGYQIKSRTVSTTTVISNTTNVAEQVTDLAKPAVGGDGTFMVVWVDSRDTNDGIAGKILQSDGNPSGTTLAISDPNTIDNWPDVAWSEEANAYLAVWETDDGDIKGRPVNSSGGMGSIVTLSDTTGGSRAKVAATGSTGLAVWQQNGNLHGQALSNIVGKLGDNDVVVSDPVTETVPALAGGDVGSAAYLLVWQDDRNGDADVYSALGNNLQNTVIVYAYDPLYRLTGAVYTGSIAAEYSYVYDAVGNMTAYTDTIATQTITATRSFNAGNQLQTSDNSLGQTTFTYDENGNLVHIVPPSDPAQRYGFNQRNLLITNTVYADGSYVPWADFDYDGTGNRLRQVFHGDLDVPIVTTYTNDILGLSQVLLADDGTTQTYNLFGLDLIYQDDGTDIRTLLADGLGSARTEMVDGAVETVTTYEPFGNLLVQTGTSGTVYGFTGEQRDSATGLQYLRARYYNPNTNRFLTPDPIVPDFTNPQSLNRYSYSLNNPVNWTDPSGLLTCTAPNAGCSQWVQDALNAIESVPIPLAKQLVQALMAKDRNEQITQAAIEISDSNCSSYINPVNPSNMPGFKIIFTDGFIMGNFGARTTPWAIYMKTKYLTPAKTDQGILLLMHELFHMKQGSSVGFSILGEVMAYQAHATFRALLFPLSTAFSSETDAKTIDLSDRFIIRNNLDRWLQLKDDLKWWEDRHPDYRIDPLFPLVNNPFPRPPVPTPGMPPHGELGPP